MSLIQELLNLKLNNLIVQYFEPGKSSFSFLLTTASGKTVAIGRQVEDDFNEKDYFFFDKMQSLGKADSTASLMSSDAWHTWAGEVFLINNSNIWHTSFNVIDPTALIDNSLAQFTKNIKYNFPELRSASEIADEEINKLTSERDEFQVSNLQLSAEIQQLKNKVSTLNNQVAQLNKQCDTLNETTKDKEVIISKIGKRNKLFPVRPYSKRYSVSYRSSEKISETINAWFIF